MMGNHSAKLPHKIEPSLILPNDPPDLELLDISDIIDDFDRDITVPYKVKGVKENDNE